ncbi:MAG: type II restriction endonuclease [Spirochaetales bacterium]|nr:type II restriction endonuclease [Spirochaetales bacterium]
MSKAVLKNDLAWEHLFRKYKIISVVKKYGFFRISASLIKEFREPRLMTKFDHKSNLPEIFRNNNLSILPVTRGDYIIAPMELYQDIDEYINSEIKYFSIPEHLQSLNQNITSESNAINSAYISGILSDFLEEEDLLPTVSGRMGSGCFSFEVNSSENRGMFNVEVENSQIEIDGGYEGLESFAIIEAKNSLSHDFLIRQLYYPCHLWSEKVKKPIRPVFMIYANGLFYLYEYKFSNINYYNSIELVKTGLYSLEERAVTQEEIVSLLSLDQSLKEPELPFPQANSFERIINLCELLFDRKLTRDEITSKYDFNSRQTNYYTDAGRYLGLIAKKRSGDVYFELTPVGNRILKLKFKERQLKFAELILKHKVFADSLKLYFKKAEEPSKLEIVSIMKACKLYKIDSENTFERRASTVLSWIDWVINLQR